MEPRIKEVNINVGAGRQPEMLLYSLIPDKPVKWEIAEPVTDPSRFCSKREPIPMVAKQIFVASMAIIRLQGEPGIGRSCSVAQALSPLPTQMELDITAGCESPVPATTENQNRNL